MEKDSKRNRHPDAGGSESLMAELNVAFAEAKRELQPPSCSPSYAAKSPSPASER